MPILLRTLAAALLLITPSVRAAGTPAAYPPMGWKSWDSHGTTVTEAEVKVNAEFMASRLKPYGWQYAAWGVDFIKADDIARPMHRDEIAALHRAIEKAGRSIVLSVSPGPATVKDLPFLQENANMWRISDDFWDDWQSLKQMFLLLSVWGGAGRPGAWPDADMLPLGHIGLRAERGGDRTSRFTHDEAQTVMSIENGFTFRLPPHGSGLFLVTAQ